MNQTSPFPGMDPFLEPHWHDVHSRLLNQISDQLASQLPGDLIVRIEQAIHLGEMGAAKRADADVSMWGDTSTWQEDWNPDYHTWDPGESRVAVTEPSILTDLNIPQRHLEIRSAGSGRQVITIVEVLSPANKLGRSGQEYLAKRKTYLAADVNFVEIDLIRQGGPLELLAEAPEQAPPYLILVRRCGEPPGAIGIDYQDRLPRFRIPLRPKDHPAILDLQLALDQCYRSGQYWKEIRYEATLHPPLPERAWNGVAR